VGNSAAELYNTMATSRSNKAALPYNPQNGHVALLVPIGGRSARREPTDPEAHAVGSCRRISHRQNPPWSSARRGDARRLAPSQTPPKPQWSRALFFWADWPGWHRSI